MTANAEGRHVERDVCIGVLQDRCEEAERDRDEARGIVAEAYSKLVAIYGGAEIMETAMLLDRMDIVMIEADAAREGGEG